MNSIHVSVHSATCDLSFPISHRNTAYSKRPICHSPPTHIRCVFVCINIHIKFQVSNDLLVHTVLFCDCRLHHVLKSQMLNENIALLSTGISSDSFGCSSHCKLGGATHTEQRVFIQCMVINSPPSMC